MPTEPLQSEQLVETEVPTDLLQDLRQLLAEESLTVDNVTLRSREHGADALLDASWTEDDGDDGWRDVHRTFVYFHRPDARFPEITIAPKSGLAAKLLFKLLSVAGMPELELEDRPKLARRCSLSIADEIRAAAVLAAGLGRAKRGPRRSVSHGSPESRSGEPRRRPQPPESPSGTVWVHQGSG
ncbi:MAG: hypothetical protein CMJ83_19525 [Planctomycetes bacterium]|jgi:hypothetical protein|nr:hypothetical protein [Planctomycetota bacterium]